MEDKNFKGLVSLVLFLGAIALAMYAYYAYVQADRYNRGLSTISITGKSEQFLKPDVATFTFTVMAEEKDATAAQNKSAEAINTIMGYLKEQGIEERDIKTEYYSLEPKYEWIQEPCAQWGICPPGKQEMKGYTVNQTVLVKVRAIEKAGDLISGVGSRGATSVGGLSLTIDDMYAVREAVREEAIKDAREKAQKLARDLGVRLGDLQNYYEENPGYPVPYYNMGKGGAESMDAAVSPTIAPGENKVTVSVNLTYEIK